MKTSIPKDFMHTIARLSVTLGLLLFIRGTVFSQATAPLKFGNSYVNLTKKTAGGTVEPGDTLEIRATFYFNGSYNGTGMVYSLRYYDNLPSKTDTINDSIRLITNEGAQYRAYSLSPSDADAGAFVRIPAFAGDYQYRINMGSNAYGPNPSAALAPDPMGITNITGAGNMKANVTHPKFGGGTLWCTAFRVKVTGTYGDTIILGAGKIVYRTTAAATTDTIINLNRYKILISKPTTLCSTQVGTNFAAENGGTFGHGTTLNRSTGPTFPIPGYSYVPNYSSAVGINDGYYGIVNNISPTSSTFAGAREVPNCNIPSAIPNTDPNSCANREFGGYWYISGDHTGTVTAAGNTPPASGTDAGYMLLVNADIATSEAYRQTISGLCPNTYYQFSAWIKNVCPTCGIDTSGTATYKPGVLPNLTFVVDSLDRYSSGQMDTLGWQKRGFVLLTGPTQTSITISLRNNAPGGGGNDWALDDIALATCPPDLLLTPNKADTLCQGADDTVRFKISSYVDNYKYWKLELSSDGGTTWGPAPVDTTGKPSTDSVQPHYNPITGLYTDTVLRYFRILPTNTFLKYRITIATTLLNLANPSCAFTTGTPKLVVGVNCMAALPTELIYFRGQMKDGMGNLQWLSSNETTDMLYTVERSDDGTNFTPIGTVAGQAGAGQGTTYHFTDPRPVTGQVYYRINITSSSLNRYSNQVLLSNTVIGLAVKSLENPFNDHITIDMTAPANGPALLTLVDMYGRVITQMKQSVNQGLNTLTLYGLDGLANGTYALQIRYADQVISKKMLKMSK